MLMLSQLKLNVYHDKFCITGFDFLFRIDKKGFGKKLKHLDLTGCLYITDLTLERLAPALSQLTDHVTESDHMNNDTDDVILEETVENITTEEEPMKDVDESVKEDDDGNAENKVDDIPVNIAKPDDKSCKDKKLCCKGERSCDASNVNSSKNEKDVDKKATPKNMKCCQIAPVNEQPTLKLETCSQNPKVREESQPKNVQCGQNRAANEKSTPKNGKCCQNTTGCTKNPDVEKKENSHGIKYGVETAIKDGIGWRNGIGNEVGTRDPEKMLKRLIKCVRCGKIDEIIGGYAEEDENCGPCYQERASNHGNQTQCCHGRASVATDRDVFCQEKQKLKGGVNDDETKNQGSKTGCLSCQGIVSHCCQGTNVLKGQGQSQFDQHNNQENIIDKPKTESASGDYESGTKPYETEHDNFPDKYDTQGQGTGFRSDAQDAGTKGTGDLGGSGDLDDLGSVALLDNQHPIPGTTANLKDSLSSYEMGQIQTLINWTNSGTNESEPVQTKLPAVFIMDDLDLQFGSKNPDETIKIGPDDDSGEESKKLARKELKVYGPPLEFLSLSGCYQITDTGLR